MALKVETTRLVALVEFRKDLKGADYYIVTTSAGRFRFTTPQGLNDFLTNNDFGYVE